jgi:arylsulfatase A-like enzyme
MPLSLRLFAVAVFLTAAFAARAEEARPNIIFILADDLGINDLSCYGREDQHTPNLDRLAEEGMRFTTAYAQPVCSPTRAALMTGKSPARLHLTTFLPGRADAPSQRLLQPQIEKQLPLEEQTIAEMLRPAGYTTGCLGKWHLGGAGFGPKEQGFDWAFAGQPATKPSATEGGKGEYTLTEMAEQFIDTNKDRPFFLYLAHDSPHIPLAAKPELVAKYGDSFNPVYAAMIETLDDCVGRIMARLDALRLTERTLLIFTSDNGGLHVLESPETPATHNSPYRAGKGFVYEGGLRVPLVVRWPGHIEPGALNKTPVTSTDWVPTWLEVAGAVVSGTFDGVSLVPLFTDGELAARNLCWHYPHYSNQGGRPAGAIISGDWKLIEHYEDGRAELFNLARDPAESTDLSAEEADRAADLRAQLAGWRQEVGAQENTPNPRYDAELARQLYHDVDASLIEAADTAAEMRAEWQGWRNTMNAAVKRNLISTDERPVIALRARDAEIHGSTLHYEAPAHRNVLTSWTNVADWPSWNFDAAAPGEYAVEMLYGCGKGEGGAEVTVEIGDQTLAVTVEDTGNFENLVPKIVGRVKLHGVSRTLAIKPAKKAAGGVMNLRQVVLVPWVEEPAKPEAPSAVAP